MARTPVSLAAIVGLVALLGGVLPASAQTIGNAVSFAIVGGAGVAVNGSGSLISGDVGINPAAATLITGIPGNGIVLPPFANHGNDGAAIAASVDVTTLYNSAALAPAGGIVTGPDLSLSGPTANGIYTPGKYFVSVGTAIVPAGGIMRLVGNGLYIFTVNSDLTTAVTGQIIFAGVDPCNVWWRVPTQAAINNASTITEPTETPLTNSGVKRSAISVLTAGSPVRRAVPPAAATARRMPSTAPGDDG